ncbi:TonB-dependent receptor domain-containing protein [Niabella drilacis]|uniref:TonB-dependent receptor n=1 Tax=Niabella drilacis (strain DSM 25811 / CCM 8410 / CCUG 62505 / LMG 26954 / E90) TaxID=1285928 RepID=A0A1G6XVJ0_NIADE|nr:TonB-dependent receptor [Niabella drilacis]SDD82189.1 TonB-dependent receptor [Niabella drilacis]
MQVRLLLTGLLIVLGNAVFSQNITGKITNSVTGEPVAGATLLIEGSNKGAISESDGAFRLNVGTNKTAAIKVTALNYITQTIQYRQGSYVADSGLVISLAPSSGELAGVVVSARARQQGTVASLYQAQRTSASISDGISAEAIRKSPDRSTGDVLKRVSGTTVQDNKFVIIRGLNDRYNLGLTDGTLLPSTEPNRKAFSFDIIPSSMIDNMIITKAGTPDLPADFAGGVINVITKEVPTRKFIDFTVGLGYNSVATFKDFKSGYRSGTDFLGFDNGARQLPASFPGTDAIEGRQLSQEQINAALSSLNNNFNIKTNKALPQLNLQANMGDLRVFNNGNKFGYTAGITYTHSETVKRNALRQYDDYNYIDNTYKYSSNIGALLNLSYQTKKGKYSFKNLYNRIFDDNFLYREGSNLGRGSDIRFYAFDLVQKSLLKNTFKGENKLGDNDVVLDYLASFNLVTNNRPDQRKVGYSRSMGTSNAFIADLGNLGRENNRLFGDLNEKIYNGAVNLTIPVNLFEKSSVKLGGFAAYRDRDDKNRMIGPIINPGASNEQEVLRSPIDQLFTPGVIGSNIYSLKDLTQGQDAYTANAGNYAGYVMLDNKFTNKLRLVWGVRYEYYNLNVNSSQNFSKTWKDFLPSANFTYSITPKTNIRASYFRSLGRPEFREIAPFYYYDFERMANVLGNPDLTRSQIDNFDLKYEWFLAPGEIISASVFYKNFKNTIETSIYKAQSALEVTTNNFPSATNIGFEAEIRKKLNFISEGLKQLEFYTNVALIRSKVKLDGPLYLPDGSTISDRPLTGQSPYAINTGLAYQTSDNKFGANVLYNRIGQRIDLVGGNLYGMVYEMPRNLLDAQVSYQLTPKSAFKLNAKDILNAPVRFYFDQNGNEKFDGSSFQNGMNTLNKDWILEQYRPGTTITLSYTYKF